MTGTTTWVLVVLVVVVVLVVSVALPPLGRLPVDVPPSFAPPEWLRSELPGVDVPGRDGGPVVEVGGVEFCGALMLGVVVLDDDGGLGSASFWEAVSEPQADSSRTPATANVIGRLPTLVPPIAGSPPSKNTHFINFCY
jgi:hypothetical protein